MQIRYLIEAYKAFPDKEAFFTKGIDRLAGTDELAAQIKAGKTEADIRKSWEPKLSEFKKIRKQYLLYPDFEQTVKLIRLNTLIGSFLQSTNQVVTE